MTIKDDIVIIQAEKKSALFVQVDDFVCLWGVSHVAGEKRRFFLSILFNYEISKKRIDVVYCTRLGRIDLFVFRLLGFASNLS